MEIVIDAIKPYVPIVTKIHGMSVLNAEMAANQLMENVSLVHKTAKNVQMVLANNVKLVFIQIQKTGVKTAELDAINADIRME